MARRKATTFPPGSTVKTMDEIRAMMNPTEARRVETKCPNCSGTGTVLDYCGSCTTKCKPCGGSGRVTVGAVYLDLDELERRPVKLSRSGAVMDTRQGESLLGSEVRELLRRARQLAAVESFLQEHEETVKTGLAALNEGGPTYRALCQLLRSLGLDERKA